MLVGSRRILAEPACRRDSHTAAAYRGGHLHERQAAQQLPLRLRSPHQWQIRRRRTNVSVDLTCASVPHQVDRLRLLATSALVSAPCRPTSRCSPANPVESASPRMTNQTIGVSEENEREFRVHVGVADASEAPKRAIEGSTVDYRAKTQMILLTFTFSACCARDLPLRARKEHGEGEMPSHAAPAPPGAPNSQHSVSFSKMKGSPRCMLGSPTLPKPSNRAIGSSGVAGTIDLHQPRIASE